MLKKLLLPSICLTLLALLLTSNPVHAQQSQNKIGLGLMVGEPTGLSFKVWTSETTAFDAGLAWSFGRYDAVNLHADYLWHHFGIFGDDINKGQLPVYYGIGGRIVFADDYPNQGDSNAVLGARVPVGVNYLFEDSPVGVFFEIAPIVNIIPETDVDFDSSLGVRFYF